MHTGLTTAILNTTDKSLAQSNVISTPNDLKPLIYSLRLTSIAASVISIRLLSNVKHFDPTYKLLKYISICDLFYSCMLLFYGIIHVFCEDGLTCSARVQFAYIMWYVAVNEYLTFSLRLFNILASVLISLQRLLPLYNIHRLDRFKPQHLVSILLLISFGFNLPIWFIFKIDKRVDLISHQETLKMTKTNFGKKSSTRNAQYIAMLFTLFLGTVVLFALNMAVILRTRHMLNRKFLYRQLNFRTSRHSVADESTWLKGFMFVPELNRKMTVMLMISSFVYAGANLPYAIHQICIRTFRVKPNSVNWILLASSCSLYFYIISKALVYYIFIHVFQKKLLLRFFTAAHTQLLVLQLGVFSSSRRSEPEAQCESQCD